VTRFLVGEPVIGSVIPLRKGCLAEYVAVAESHLGRIPDNVPPVDASGITVACSTAYVGLRHRSKDLRGRRVLLTGGGGGVGQFVIQLGRVFGAHITAVCSEEKVKLCQVLGADLAVRLLPVQSDHSGQTDVGVSRRPGWNALRSAGHPDREQ